METQHKYSNVMIIGKAQRTANTNPEIHIGDQSLTIRKEFKYLGCIVNSNGNFTATHKEMSLNKN